MKKKCSAKKKSMPKRGARTAMNRSKGKKK